MRNQKIRVALLLYYGGLKLSLQYLQGMPVCEKKKNTLLRQCCCSTARSLSKAFCQFLSIFSSVMSNLLLNPLIKLLISVTICFISRTYICFFFKRIFIYLTKILKLAYSRATLKFAW